MSLDNILYELFVYAEWKPDPDLIRGDQELFTTSNNSAFGWLLNILQPEQTLKQKITGSIEQLQNWQICLGDNGKVIAILQDTILEIRSKRNNFTNIIARVRVPRDPNPQWRKISWSPDCSMIAVGASNGNIHFYDLSASSLFEIPSECNLQSTGEQCLDTTHAIAGMIFLTCRITEQKWSSEFLVVDYKGTLRSYFVSPTDGFKLSHKFNFERGCSTISYHKSHNMIYLTGLPVNSKKLNSANDFGLIGWRLLNDSPYYKESIYVKNNYSDTFTSWIMNNLLWTSSSNVNIISKSAISPSGKYIACLHTIGDVSIWQLPTLKLVNVWSLKDQPEYDYKNASVINNPKIWKITYSEFLPIDLNWWDEEAVIISRCNGSITICSLIDLHNILGNNPEFFQGHPQITPTFENCFLSLECEGKLVPANKFRQDMNDSNIINKELLDTYDVEDDENQSLLQKSTNLVKSVLFTITDIERFQPKPKKLNVLAKIYRLICLRSTTPSDLYLRKIEIGDYDEALELAKTYDLDSDLVYQQRWRSSNVCHTSITNYLSKISKKLWVIQQCCDRVAETLDSAKELLNFGLSLSNEIILDSNCFGESKKEKDEFLESLTIENLSAQDIEIIRCRYAMLFYLDRLKIYQNVIESENGSYLSEEYSQLRNGSLVQMATKLAREGRVTALNSIWPYLLNVNHQLTILENLPETLDPAKYRHLLPSLNSDSVVFDQEKKSTCDWCEKSAFRSIWDSFCDDENDTLLDVSSSPDSHLTEWFIRRAHEIEELCGLPCHALKLISFAIENGIPNLDVLNMTLITLNTLVYNICLDNMTLEVLDSSSHVEIVQYLTSKCTSENIVTHVINYLFPYFERCCELKNDTTLKNHFLKEFIVSLCNKDLNFSLILMKNWKQINLNVKDCLDVAENIFLSLENNQNIVLCFDIYDALPKICDDSIAPSYINRVLDEMERTLKSLSLLESYGVNTTYENLKKITNNVKEGETILNLMAQSALKRTKPLKNDELNELLADILNVRDKIFDMIPVDVCTEIYVSALLQSAHIPTINSTKKLLTAKKSTSPNNPLAKVNVSLEIQKLSWDKSKELVLKTARNYFNSASTISDPALRCAWSCLQITHDDDSDIQYEKDLILALRLIEEFELSILPMQVRMFDSKFGLLEECLACNSRAFKYIERILLLGKYLHIEQNNEKKREILIVSLCAEKALEMEDYEEANILSKRLLKISSGFSSYVNATAVQKLGSNSQIGDANLRFDLLNLALLNCDPQNIENILQSRLSVEAEILQSEINNVISVTNIPANLSLNLQDSIESTEDDFSDALTSPQNDNKTIIGVMEKFIQKPLTALGDKLNLKDTLNFNWLSKISDFKEEERKPNGLNDIFLNCHSFYKNLHEKCHLSSLSLDYKNFTVKSVNDKQILLLQAFVRNELLQNSISYGYYESKSPHEALLQCGETIINEDTALGLSHLLTVCDFLKSNESPISPDVSTIKTLIYFYAILCFIENGGVVKEAFIMPPNKLVDTINKSINSIDENDHSMFMKNFISCLKSLNEIREGEKLEGLGCNVDVTLFIKDADYRKAIILELSRSFSKKNIQTALDLAKKYDVDICELGLSHISYVILHHNEIERGETIVLLKNAELIESFQKNAQYSLQWIIENIWNILNGCDHQGLINCLNVIKLIDSHYTINNLNVYDHLKLVKKADSACTEINYKSLINPPIQEYIEKSLVPILNKENVGIVAKLLRNLPAALHTEFNSSRFFRLWLLKYFFNVPHNLMNSKKWLQQYRECYGYFNKLNKDDLLDFTKAVLFEYEALEKIPPSTRIQIANQTNNYCVHEWCNDEEHNVPIKTNTTDSFDIVEKIEAWVGFIERVHSEKLSQCLKKFKQDFPEIFREIEHSRGEYSEILGALKVVFCYNEMSSKDIVDALEELKCNVKVEDIILFMTNEGILSQSELNMISQRIIDLSPKYKISDEVLEKIKPYANSNMLSSQQRLGLLRLFKTNSDTQELDVLVKITDEIISSTWSKEKAREYEDKNLSNEPERINLFLDLIQNANSWEELKTIIDLVNMWPQISQNSNDLDKDVYVNIIIKLLEDINRTDENIPLLKLFLEKHNVDSKVQSVLTKDFFNPIGKLWLCLLTNFEDISSIINQMKNVSNIENYVSDDLILTLLNNGLFIKMVKTPLYPFMTQMVLKSSVVPNPDCQYTIKQAITDLCNNKLFAEAGALTLAINNVPQALRTFSAAMFAGKSNNN